LRYLGSTRGYFRRVLARGIEVAPVCSSGEAINRWIAAKRFSSSSFSASMRVESTLPISSCSDQRSSREIDSNPMLGSDKLGFLAINNLLHAKAAKAGSSSHVSSQLLQRVKRRALCPLGFCTWVLSTELVQLRLKEIPGCPRPHRLSGGPIER